MEQKQLETIIENAYQAGYMKCLEFMRKLPTISRNQAEKIYGYKKIKHWTETEQIKLIHSGAGEKTPFQLSIIELELLNQKEELREVTLKS